MIASIDQSVMQGRGSIPWTSKCFSSLRLPVRQSLVHSFLWNWYGRTISPGVLRPGCKTDHSPTSSAEVDNGEVMPPVPVMPSWHSGLLRSEL
jgi:hypothetical protein